MKIKFNEAELSKAKFNKAETIKELLNNPNIAKAVNDANLTNAQIEEALPILIDMDSQSHDQEYIISFYVTPSGSVKRTEILSEIGKKLSFRSNITTLKIFPVNFDESKEYFKDDERKLLVSEFAKYLHPDAPKKGLYIYGPMGVGKSFTVKRFAKKLAEAGKKVGIVSLPELVSKVKATFGGTENDKYAVLQENLKTVEILFIDDIGAEAITSWFRDEFLFSILNTRMEAGLTTFFTSNYNYADLTKMESRTAGQKYRDLDKSERLLTRIRTLTKPIVLNGINRRY